MKEVYKPPKLEIATESFPPHSTKEVFLLAYSPLQDPAWLTHYQQEEGYLYSILQGPNI